ncbi:hypothetical protein BKA61DRAFT_707178 [Leptodontidium sp. MPI-SDFR-AT-0119]|nr:hypothetical protein BKA61DRAFT_707178 [Leptodontidium sp. MPI-SDFR-AT-0119]
MADNARIGYPQIRSTTPNLELNLISSNRWTYRIGPEKAKRMLLTDDLINGKEAELESTVNLLTDRLKDVPSDQLWMQKQVVNNIIEGSVAQSQRSSTVFDSITRNNPSIVAFQRLAGKSGFKAAVKERDKPGRTKAYQKR